MGDRGMHQGTAPRRRIVPARVIDMDVEQFAVWTYYHQKAQHAARQGLFDSEMAADGRRVFRASTDGCVAVERVAALGGFVDGGGYASGECHPDAEAFHSQVERTRNGAYVLLHARSGGTRPEIPDAIARLEPRWLDGPAYRNGLPEPGAFKVVHGGRPIGPLYCPIAPLHDETYVAFALDEYAQWRGALLALVDYFTRHPLRDYRLTGPEAPNLKPNPKTV